MRRRRRTSYRRTLKNLTSAATTAYGHLDRAATAIGRWVSTDHTGFTQAMLDMPRMGFKHTCYYIIVHFLILVAGALLSGLLIFVMIAYGIPALLLFSQSRTLQPGTIFSNIAHSALHGLFFSSADFTPQRRHGIPVLGRFLHFRKEIFMFSTTFITNQQPFAAIPLRKSPRRHPCHHANPSLEVRHAHPA